MEVESQLHLYGHTAEVTSLFVCKPYSILISVSKDGTCILWDLNRCVTLKTVHSSLGGMKLTVWLRCGSAGCATFRASRDTKVQ